MIKFVYFGSSKISEYVLEELAKHDLVPIMHIVSAKDPLDLDMLRTLEADVFVVASFGKILTQELLDIPPKGVLNMHPSLLPRLRGPAPIQAAILNEASTGVSIMLMDAKMDHGPILAQQPVDISPWPDGYATVEEKLGRAGGVLLAEVLPKWMSGEIAAAEQDHSQATVTKFIKKEDADISNDAPEAAYRKILAYQVWPRARKDDLIITQAHLENSELILDRVIPPGKKEMPFESYQNGLKGKR